MSPHINPISNTDILIVIQQRDGRTSSGRPKALVECPSCGEERSVCRSSLRRRGHSLCASCALIDWIEDVPGFIIVLQQSFDHGESGHTRSLVVCPDCGTEFVRERYALRRYGSICMSCARIEQIPDIPGERIILEQLIAHRDTGMPLALVRCPACGDEFQRDRAHLKNRGHSFCRACNVAGERSANWKGGNIGYRGADWQRIRPKIVERDECTCQYCGKVCDSSIHVHHIEPYRETQDNSPENLIALCDSCHGWADANLDESVPVLNSILARKHGC